MVLVVLFPLPDEKNVDVKTIFTCSQTCLLEMNLRVLTMHPLETRIAPRQASLKALSKGALTVQAFRNVLADIHLKLHDATVLQGDNKSAITVAECPGAHRSKLAHLENSAFKVRELIDGAAVRLVWCPTDENAADIFTKSLGTRKFKKFQAFLLGLPQDGEFKALICRMLFM